MRRRFIAALLAAALLGGCNASTPQFQATDITGADYGKDFSLTDQTGRQRSLADFRGKVVTLFFGYTQCPDVCPTALTTMVQVKKLLGADAAKLQVLFLTVDPERDTQQLLSEYVPAFDPGFIGLRADPAKTPAVLKEFHVYAQKQGDIASGNYSVDHSTGTFVYDTQGRLRLYVKMDQPPAAIAKDLQLLLNGA